MSLKPEKILNRERQYWEARSKIEWLSSSGIRAVLERIPPVRGDILELCSGSGMFTKHVPATYESYTCLDLSQELLDTLSQTVPQIDPVQGNAEIPVFPAATFDMVLIFAGLHHLPREEKAIQSAYDLLSPGGTIVAFEPNAACWYRKPMLAMDSILGLYTEDERFLQPDELVMAMQTAGFLEIEVDYLTPEYNPAHLGTPLNKMLAGLMRAAASISHAPAWQSFFIAVGKK